jgi:hypothetical protein
MGNSGARTVTFRKMAKGETPPPQPPLPPPTPEETATRRARHEQWEAERVAELARIRRRLDGLAGLPKVVADLHSPDIHGPLAVCDGCDMDGFEAERPEWPCRTINTLLAWMEAHP